MKQIDTGQSKETEQWVDHLVGTVGDITDNAEEDQLGTPHPEDDPAPIPRAAPADQKAETTASSSGSTNEPSGKAENAALSPSSQTPPVKVFPYTPGRSRLTHADVQVAPEFVATVTASSGANWSALRTHIDNSKSPYYGMSLRSAMEVYGIERLEKGSLVTIEIAVGNRKYVMTGRASRKAAAYFRKSYFEEVGIPVHRAFHAVILSVETPTYPA